jgi:hypothetical protein
MLDLEKIKQLYEFGGLMVYEVLWFDTVMKRNMTHRRTFCSKTAEKELEHLGRLGRDTWMVSYMVQFDDAYLK